MHGTYRDEFLPKMALSMQSSQNSRGVSVRPLATLRAEAAGLSLGSPLLAERLLASQLAGHFPPLPHELYRHLAWAAPPSPASPPSPDAKLLANSKPRRRRAPVESLVPSPDPAPLSPPSSGSSPPSLADPPRDKSFTCKICSRSFGYKHVLQNHERTHTGEKPFECGECHKRFTRDHHLKTHLRLHTGEKPYSCPHCPRHFVQVANLRRHLRVHTGERPYACPRCPARFSDSNQLKAHVLAHDSTQSGVVVSRGTAAAPRGRHVAERADSGCEADAPASPDNWSMWRWPEEPVECTPPEQTEPEDLSLPRCSPEPEDLRVRHA